MKKRSACKILMGIVALCGLSSGQCGTVTLKGDAHVAMRGTIVIHGLVQDTPGDLYALGIGCGLCASFSGPCVSVDPSNISVGGRNNAADVVLRRHGNGHGFSGNYVFWRAAHVGEDNWVEVNYTCDNASRPDWTWVNSSYYRDRYTPRSSLYAVATNHTTGETVTKDLGRGGDWRPWRAVHPEGDVVGDVRVSVSYPERIVLRGKGAKTQVLYDIKGNVPVYALIDKAPNGLSCARASDGVIVDVGVSAAVGVGDSIACTNRQNTAGETTGTLSITAMVR